MQDECVLAKILVQANAPDLPVGSPIALVVEDLDEYSNFIKMDSSVQMTGVSMNTVTAAAPPSDQKSSVTPVNTSTVTVDPSLPVRLSPAARHMVHTLQLNASSISVDPSVRLGTNKNNKLVRKEDVIRAVQSGQATKVDMSATTADIPSSAAPVAPPTPIAATISSTVDESGGNGYVDIPNNNIRKVIAKRLLESKQKVPHSYASQECNIDALMKFRTTLKNDLGVNVSVNDLIIKAASLSLRDVPAANSRFDPVSGTVKEPITNPTGGPQIDISVAVATPTGLITPIVFGADRRGLSDINNTVKDLAGRAKDGKLKPEEFQGGSFTISNLGENICMRMMEGPICSDVYLLILGMFGISEFTAVINPPQACILAVGGGIQRVAIRGGEPVIETTMTVQMSSDRRVVDDQTAALFLQVFFSYCNYFS